MATNPYTFWLVKTQQGGSELQRFQGNQKPLGANWKRGTVGSAVYLGNTVADANKYLAKAARQLGVPDPTNVPSLGTSLGIIGAEVAGFGAGVGAAVGGSAEAVAASEGATATEAGAAGAGGATAASKLGGAASKLGTGIKAAAGALTVASLFTNPGLWGGIAMALLGAVLILFGIVKLSGGDPTKLAKRVVA